MDTSEKIVKQYFELVEGCFTRSDIKVIGGNNRQLDLLAFHPQTHKTFHVEVHVSHCCNWNFNSESLKHACRSKFFGQTEKTNILNEIKQCYTSNGLSYNSVQRVWVEWHYRDSQEKLTQMKKELAAEFNLNPQHFHLLSFRDDILPKLYSVIGTSRYEDDLLRLLSLLKQSELQLNA